MNTPIQTTHKRSLAGLISFVTLAIIMFTACEKELPEEGSIADLTPPNAAFTYAQFSPDNYLEVTFSNASTSATDYLWTFGDGETSTDKEPVHIYPSDGTYTVTLDASDKLGVVSTLTMEITLTEPLAFIPPIIESSFEDGQLEGGTGDGRDSWRNSALGGVIQITSDPVNTGLQAAKLTGVPGDARIGYQLITVTENTVYDITFNYTMLESPAGFLTVSVLDGPVSSHEEAIASTIGSKTVNDQSNPSAFVQEVVTFNSGPNTEVAIYFFNEGSVETRLDDFSINIGSGTVPPSASFSYEEDAADYLQINFTNNSINADNYSWNFGDGTSSTDENPSHTYTADGTYTVTLTASNNAGESAMSSVDITLAAPSDIMITNPSFDLYPVNNDNREDWRNLELESSANAVFGASSYVLQMSSTSRTGAFGGKLPTAENAADPRRWIYQAITVVPNTDYEISGWIRNKDAGVGSTVTFTIYNAPFSDAAIIDDPAFIISSADFDESTGHDTNDWTEATISFNSGSSSEIVLFITNDYTLNGDPVTEESESFFDDFSIQEQ